MLGKLIKHELKANYKLMLITHAFILLLSLILSIFVWLRSASVDSGLNFTNGIMSFYIVLLFVAMTAISVFGTQVYIAVRFYRNFFTDEGYLMFTLPTTPTQLLHSKIITGSILIFFNLIVVGLSAFIIYFSLITQTLGLGNTLMELLANVAPLDILIACVSYFFDFVAALLLIYGCICIGQLFHKNRLVAAIVTYLGVNFIRSIISLIISLTTNTASFTYSINTTTIDSANTFSSNMDMLNIPSLVLSIISIGVFYLVSRYIMNKKLNLV